MRRSNRILNALLGKKEMGVFSKAERESGIFQRGTNGDEIQVSELSHEVAQARVEELAKRGTAARLMGEDGQIVALSFADWRKELDTPAYVMSQNEGSALLKAARQSVAQVSRIRNGLGL